VIVEEIWRRGASAAREDLFPTLRYGISGIVAIETVRRHARESGKKRSWQTIVTTERTRLKLKGSGAAETRVTGERTGRRIRPIQRRIVWVRRIGISAGGLGQGLQKWTS
jgi:hypothetical protein